MSDSYEKDARMIAEILDSLIGDKKQFQKSLKNHRKALEYQSALRGKYLVAFTSLESDIEKLIAQHFCKNQDYQNMLIAWVLRYLPFHRKMAILENVLDCYKQESIKTARARHALNLKKINEFRNDLAHLEPHIIDKKFDKRTNAGFHLILYNGARKQTKEISIETFSKKLEDVKETDAIVNLLRALIFKYSS